MAEAQLLAALAQGGGRIYQGYGSHLAGRAEATSLEQAAAVEAAGLRSRAMEARASAQRQAKERRDASERVQGSQLALAAASGGGVTGTILDIMDETVERGEIQAQTEMYKGENAARGMEDRARIGTWQAEGRARQSRVRGDSAFTGSILEGTGKMVEGIHRYGDRQGWWNRENPEDRDPRNRWRQLVVTRPT